LITGFFFVSPKEAVLVLEARDAEPFEGCGLLDGLGCERLMSSRELTFGEPRLYGEFERLVKRIDCTKSLEELVTINGLYSRHSAESLVLPVIQKLTWLMKCRTLKEADICGFFPTVPELLQIIAMKINLISVAEIESVSAREEEEKKERVEGSVHEVEMKRMNRIGRQRERPRFEPYGRVRDERKRVPRGRIGCWANGEEELWVVDDPSVLEESGWRVEVVKGKEGDGWRRLRSPASMRGEKWGSKVSMDNRRARTQLAES
jgi:hypothetical protein